MKKNQIISIIVLALLALLVLAANMWRRHQQVKGVRVDIDYCGSDTLVTAQQVESLIIDSIPGLLSKQLREVDVAQVEHVVATSPYLYDCKATKSIGGNVMAFASQRRPIIRVCASEEYYLDATGRRLPCSSVGSCDVIVASGHIPAKGKGQKEVWTLAAYLDSHPDLSPLFDQIYRDAKGDLYLTPKLGNHLVQVGNVERLDDKFHNLIAFYTRGLPQVGWDKYSQVSVKYRGQVVCTKRKTS